MSFWITTRTKIEIIVKVMILTLAVILVGTLTAMPVWASDMPDNIVVYENKEKTLKITEISFTHDFKSMSVLVENIRTKANFRIEHELDTGDTFNEYIEITATDGMGNISETVHIKNPFYTPVVIEEPPITGSLNVTGGNGSGITSETKDVSADEAKNEDETKSVPADDESAAQTNGFNTSGWASVVDNAATDSKEFFIVRSETGSEFYMIIDRENGKDNVYFLNTVTEWDLLGLTEKFEVPNNLAPDSPLNNTANTATANDTASTEPQDDNADQNTQSTPAPTEDTETPTESPQQGGIGIFGILSLIVFVGAIGAYFYFFKIKKKTTPNASADEYLPDDYGDDDEDDEDDTNGADSDDEDGDEYEDDEEIENTTTETKESGEPPTETEEATKEIKEAPNPRTEPSHKPKPESKGKPVTHNPPAADNPDNDDGKSDYEAAFTDNDVGDDDYGEQDGYYDYEEEIDENDVLGGDDGGDDEDEDSTV